uniref:Uncharacterized protein n=1 Tax=Arundo donax TaxID=35708 RepID=A0A0A9BG84_ARUDO
MESSRVLYIRHQENLYGIIVRVRY